MKEKRADIANAAQCLGGGDLRGGFRVVEVKMEVVRWWMSFNLSLGGHFDPIIDYIIRHPFRQASATSDQNVLKNTASVPQLKTESSEVFSWLNSNVTY